MNKEWLPRSDTLKLHVIGNIRAHIRGDPNDVMGVPVTSSIGKTPLNTNKEFCSSKTSILLF